MGGGILKHILIHLNCTKYNEINKCHLDMQKRVSYKNWYKYSYTGSHKRYLLYYGLCLEMSGKIFSIAVRVLFLLY